MRPNFGTNIWNMLFEPFSEEVEESILLDVKTVVGYDPRVVLEEAIIDNYEHGINIRITLRFLTENLVDRMTLQFDRDNQTLLRI